MRCKSIGGCDSFASTRGYCERHYRRRLRLNRYGRVDGTEVREHILKLRALDWTWQEIDEASGVGTAWHLASGKTRNVLAESVEKFLSIPLVSHAAPAVGIERRVNALGRMGYSRIDVASLFGVCPSTLVNIVGRDTIPRKQAEPFYLAYEKHCHIPGPSRQAAARAKSAGWAPWWAWDSDTIDDPDAMPNLTGYDETTVRALIEGKRPQYRRVDLDEAVRRTSHLTKAEQVRLFGATWHFVQSVHKQMEAA